MESNELPKTPDEVVVDPNVNPETSPEPATDSVSAESETNPEPAPEAQAEAQDTVPTSDEAAEPQPQKMPETKAELLVRLKALSEQPAEEISSDMVTRLKLHYYQLRNDELSIVRDKFIADGNGPETFNPGIDPDEDEFKQLLAIIKEHKAELRASQEAAREANLARKQMIIDELVKMASDTDKVNVHYSRAKELQAEFKTIGEVPAPKAADIWKSYQDAVELFYDQWKVNKELRDYDFKKNLEQKQQLVAEAKQLAEDKDPVAAFKRLQDLHDKWREIGPVAKELRTDLWNEFRDASAIVNKRYQAYFEERKAKEQENEAGKTALCERVEALDFSALSSYAAWEAMTKTIIAAQEEWKQFGFASRKTNTALFARFRAVCDAFFAAKAAFYKKIKDELAENLRLKTALCEKAEELKESTEWKKTTDALVELQKEWKTIGPVTKKHSDAVWRRFLAACDYFFDKKKKVTSGTRRTEQANLKAKQEIIKALTELNAEDSATPRAEAISAVKELRTQWQSIGFVPFKEKERIQETYRNLLGELFMKLDIHENRARMERFESNIESLEAGDSRLVRERERLARQLEQRRQELNTYENNLGFLSSKSKSGDLMVKELERKTQRIKDDIKALEEKIKLIDRKG